MTSNFRRAYKVVVIVFFFTLAGSLSGCSAKTTEGKHSFPMAPMDGMPAEVRESPILVQQSYQFAAANPEVLQQIPCYCGCGNMGHTSNYACYIGSAAADGTITYDTHALGCSICVDITQDVMRLLDEGKSVAEIKAYIDQTYAKYGPSNMP